MGHVAQAQCRDCGSFFSLEHGGGFFFHLLRCVNCGKTKSVGFKELGELHSRYLKGLKGPYSIASAEYDRDIQQHVKIEPISEEEYNKAIEAIAGVCSCGAYYAIEAPPRCPYCRSTNLEEHEEVIMYYD